MSAFLRKYGTGTGADIYMTMIKRGVVDHAVGTDWTPAAGDVKISKDGGAAANIGTLPVAVAMGNSAIWKFVFTDAELQAAYITVTIADSATKAVEDNAFAIETYGNASALHAFDLDTATQSVNATQFAGQTITAAAGVTLPSSVASPTNITAATGVVLSAAGVQAIWDALTSALTTVGSIGKLLVDRIDAAITSRLASASYTAPDNAGISTAATEASGANTKAADLQTRVPAALVGGRMDASVGAVAAAASNIKKNAASAGFTFVMTDSTNHNPATGLTVTAERSIDGAAFAACANAVVEISNGAYKIDLAAADVNGNHILFRFTAAGADDRFIEIITQP